MWGQMAQNKRSSPVWQRPDPWNEAIYKYGTTILKFSQGRNFLPKKISPPMTKDSGSPTLFQRRLFHKTCKTTALSRRQPHPASSGHLALSSQTGRKRDETPSVAHTSVIYNYLIERFSKQSQINRNTNPAGLGIYWVVSKYTKSIVSISNILGKTSLNDLL